MSKRHQGRYTSFDSGRQREAEHMHAQQHMFRALHAQQHDRPREEARAVMAAEADAMRIRDTCDDW
jgi:hypothetical protein